MFIFTSDQFTIYFGDASQSITTHDIQQKTMTTSIHNIAQQVGADQVVFLQQTHGVQGAVIKKSDDQSQFLQQQGDVIITNKKNCGIGVLTADCLPIVIYDPITHSAGIVHAGWKGSVANIFEIAIKKMAQEFTTYPADLQIYFGPAAGACCYEVSPDFMDNFKLYPNYQDAFIEKNNKIYFDSAVFTAIIARNLGIEGKNIYTTYNVCTICNTSFCSYRREKENASRQITLISLH